MRTMSASSDRAAAMTLGGYAEALASEQPTPGGGSAAAVAASLAASLTAMVVRLSLGRERYAQHAGLHDEALATSDTARSAFLELADADAAAYAAYRTARSLPRTTEREKEARANAIREAALGATNVPLQLAEACQRQIRLVERLAGRTNTYVSSDLDVAAVLLEAAARSAAANVAVNLTAVQDESFAGAVTAELDQRLQQIQTAADRTREHIHAGGSRQPEGP
jgi:formiminotetrahydrofolate cyclodeaminase